MTNIWKTRLLRGAAATLAAVLVTASGGSFLPVEAADKASLENQLADLKSQEQKIKNQLNKASGDLKASQQRKNLIDSQIANAEKQIAVYERQLAALDSEIGEKQAAITAAQTSLAEKEASIADTREKLYERLRAVMKSGNVTTMQMLLNTENYTDYLIKSKAIERIAARDQATIDELEAALVEINAQKAQLETERDALQDKQQQVQGVKAASDAKKRELDTLCDAAEREVNNLANTVGNYQSNLAATQQKIRDTDAAIAALITGSGSTGKYNQSMMYWPVPTVRTISSRFGERWGTMHRGLDIANHPTIPIYGQNIVAAADGTVIGVNSTSWYGTGWSYGYGYCVLIDHGYNSKGVLITTMYAHCSSVKVSVGQKVVGGKTVIAQAGKSGDVTGPHLHFEVRENGVKVDPLNGYVSPNVN